MYQYNSESEKTGCLVGLRYLVALSLLEVRLKNSQISPDDRERFTIVRAQLKQEHSLLSSDRLPRERYEEVLAQPSAIELISSRSATIF